MSDYQIRTATLEDLPVLYEFEQGIITAERPFDPTLGDDINYYDLKEMIQADHVSVAVAISGDRLVGSGYIKVVKSKPYLRFEEHGYIGFVFVDPAHRGRGVSNLLMDCFKAWAKSKGITEIRLDVYLENKSAVRAYEKAGFTPNLLEMRMDITDREDP